MNKDRIISYVRQKRGLKEGLLCNNSHSHTNDERSIAEGTRSIVHLRSNSMVSQSIACNALSSSSR